MIVDTAWKASDTFESIFGPSIVLLPSEISDEHCEALVCGRKCDETKVIAEIGPIKETSETNVI